jgi:hypothetical protein
MHANYNAEHDKNSAFDLDLDDCASLDTSNVVVPDSAKLQVAISIITSAVKSGDRILVVSNFTVTLDIVQEVLNHRGFTYMRLDGSTPVRLRTDLVKNFNSASCSKGIFLLSAKAGGVGLNLIGANRLILFDPDWNPATDLQAMARVWRDGQQKDVFVYRLLSTGTIEEKIYQRQLFKGELQGALGGANFAGEVQMQIACPRITESEKHKVNDFSAEDLKDLFTYRGDEMTYCDTLEILERCQQDTGDRLGAVRGSVSNSRLLSSFQRYRHWQELPSARNDDDGITQAARYNHDDVLDYALNHDKDSKGIVSYLFTKSTSERLRPDFDQNVDGLKGDSDPCQSLSVDDSYKKEIVAADLSTPATAPKSNCCGPVKRPHTNANTESDRTAELQGNSGISEFESCDDSLNDADIARPLSSRLQGPKCPSFHDTAIAKRRQPSRRSLVPESDSESASDEIRIIPCRTVSDRRGANMEHDQNEREFIDADNLTWSKVVDDLTLDL